MKKINKKYEFLKHTADAKFRAYGKNLEEAFKNGAYAMTDIITDHKKVKPRIKKEFEIESEDRQALLYDFLEQFIAFVDSENFILSKINSVKIKQVNQGFELKASFSGDNIIENYDIKTTIKAVTYQEMIIQENKNKVMIQVVIDI